MRRLSTLVLSSILAVGLAAAIPVAAGAQDTSVEVVDNAFSPAEATVTAGSTVTWTHTGQFPHSVTADDGSFDSHPNCGSDCMTNGDTFEATFDEPGDYAYYCRIHGAAGGVGMSGVITVTAAADPSPSPTPTDTASPSEATSPTETASPTEAASPTETETASAAPTEQASDAADDLPQTGTDRWWLLALALGLVAVGIGAVATTRQR